VEGFSGSRGEEFVAVEAMILAAGEGTRLLPLTRQKPKPLFPILTQPLLHLTLDYLEQFDLQRVTLNTHHLAAQIEDFIRTEKQIRSFEIQTSFEPTILGTGGGIGRTRNFWSDSPFLVINGDIVTNIDLFKALEFHRSHQGPVTLIVHDYKEFNQVAVDPQGRIADFRLEKGNGAAFTGIHILDRSIFTDLPSSGSYDIIPIYQQMIRKGIPIRAYVSQGHYWRDIGTPKSYLRIHEELLTGSTHFPFLMPKGSGGRLIHPDSQIEKGVELSGWVCLGKGCRLREGCRIHNSVLWEEVDVEPGREISESIIGRGLSITRDMRGEVLV
jgi:NDP-sugar pyrophosphorylase family protein